MRCLSGEIQNRLLLFLCAFFLEVMPGQPVIIISARIYGWGGGGGGGGGDSPNTKGVEMENVNI